MASTLTTSTMAAVSPILANASDTDPYLTKLRDAAASTVAQACDGPGVRLPHSPERVGAKDDDGTVHLLMGAEGMDASFVDRIDAELLTHRIRSVARVDTGRPMWAEIIPSTASDEEIKTAMKKWANDFNRLRKFHLNTVVQELGQGDKAYIMTHSHKGTHVSTEYPLMGYIGPLPTAKAKQLQKDLMAHHKSKETDTAQQSAGEKSYAHFVPLVVNPGEFYPLLQCNPPALRARFPLDEAQDAFQREHTELALTGLAYHARKFIKQHINTIVRSTHMFNVVEDLPPVRSNAIERVRDQEQESYQLFCQHNRVRSLEHYMERDVLLTMAKDGADVRHRLQEMFLSQAERERQRKDAKADNVTDTEKDDDDDNTEKDKDKDKEEDDTDDKAKDDDTDDKAKDDDTFDENDDEDDDDDDEDDDDDDDNDTFEEDEDDDDDMSLDIAPHAAPVDNTSKNATKVSAKGDVASGDASIVLQRTVLPDEADLTVRAPAQHFTVFLNIDNFDVMGKAVDVYNSWLDVREYLISVFRRPYIVHYLLARYLYDTVLEGDLTKFTDDDLASAAQRVFGGTDPTLAEDLSPLRRIVDTIEDEAVDSFYKNYKREEAMLTCAEWTAFFNQFNYEEIVEDLVRRHNARVTQDDKKIKFSKKKLAKYAPQKGAAAAASSAQQGPIVLEEVQTHAREQGMEHVLEEDSELPSLTDLLEGRYVYDPNEAPYDSNALETTTDGHVKRKARIGADTDKGDADADVEPQPQTIEELVEQKSKRLHAILMENPEHGWVELYRTFLTNVAETVILTPNANGVYTPPRRKRERKGMGYDPDYFYTVVVETVARLIPTITDLTRTMYKAQRTKFIQERFGMLSKAPGRDSLAHEHFCDYSDQCQQTLSDVLHNNESMLLPIMSHRDPRQLDQSMQRVLNQQFPWMRMFRLAPPLQSYNFVNMVDTLKRHGTPQKKQVDQQLKQQAEESKKMTAIGSSTERTESIWRGQDQ